MTDNITLYEKPATEPYKLPTPEASENVDAWIDYFYAPPDSSVSGFHYWGGFALLCLVGLAILAFGVYAWLKKKEKRQFTGQTKNQ